MLAMEVGRDRPLRGVVWRRSRFAQAHVTLAAVLLVSWLAGALVLWRVQLRLPLDYFGGSADDEGVWSNGQYNTVISIAADFVGAIIGYALKHTFCAVLRSRLLRPEGISLYAFDALSNFSQRQLQFKFAWSAVFAAFLFLLDGLFGGATQAAFGSSVSQTNITHVLFFLSRGRSLISSRRSVPFRRARISDNTDLVLPYLSNLSSLLSASDEADANVDAVVSSLSPSSIAGFNSVPGDVHATILNTLELSSATEPLFAAQSQLRLIQGVFLDQVENNLTERETRLLRPSREITAYATVEGFFASSSCTLISPNFTAAPSPTLNVTAFSISFPCGTKEAYYRPSTSPISDVFLCPDNSPFVFLFSALPSFSSSSPPSLLFTYSCTLTTSSALLPMTFSPLLRAARPTGPSFSPTPLPAFVAPALLSADVLTSFGPEGWTVLQNALEVVEQRRDNRTEFVQRTVETLAKVTLARASFVFSQAAQEGFEAQDGRLRYEEATSEFQVDTLQISLDNSTLYYLSIPLLLLLVLLLTAPVVLSPRLARDAGHSDFTDPVSTLLIALGSEEDETVRGAGTGEFAGEEEEREKKVRVRFGERVRKREQESGGRGLRRLEVTAKGEREVEMRRPERGVEYV
ncbi:hypothetical protein JCM8547_003675 [Rhodosporidiobolus lusitaniae]